MKFRDYKLDSNLLKAINQLGYEKPLEVQEKVIPKIMDNKDVIIKAKTGSGKSAAFLIPIINNIKFEDNKASALILTPTRELAIQIKDDASHLAIYKKLKAVAIYGKVPYKQQIVDLNQRVHIVVGSIGRVLDMIERGHLDLSMIKYVVIDEADEMFKMGFIEELSEILSYIKQQHLTVLCSATFNPKVIEIQEKYMASDYELIEVVADKPNIEEVFYQVENRHKLQALEVLLANTDIDSAIIFTNHQESVDQVYTRLSRLRIPVTKIHGGLDQKIRIFNLNDFSKGKFRILVATDIAARGLDIDSVSHIINYDMPTNKDIYTHRIGRSARVSATGIAINFVASNDSKVMESLDREVLDFIYPLDVNNNFNHLQAITSLKKDKYADINSNIFKIYLNGGKSKKIRPTNIVAAICDIEGVTNDDIGVISVQSNQSYVDILNGKGQLVIDGLRLSGVKGKKLKVQKAKN